MTTISKALQCGIFALAASAAGLAGSARAVACELGAATSDKALMNTFPVPVASSTGKFVTAQAADFDVLPLAWTGHGLEAFDDVNFEYTKHWMSSYLVGNGHEFEHRVKGVASNGQQIDLLLDRAFHNARDYYTMAKGEPTDSGLIEPWHGRFVSLLGSDDPVQLGLYRFSTHPPVSAALFWPLALFPETTESVTTFCGLYDVRDHVDMSVGGGQTISVFDPDSQNIYGSPSERASDLIHEGMHAHYRDVKALDHVRCPQDPNDGGCDHFYPHPKADYAGGDLFRADDSSHKIPAYEIQLEYLCDLADEAQDWVPLALLSDAEAAADRTAKGHFVDSRGLIFAVPPFDCGVPAPMMEVPAAACESAACDADTPCNQGVCFDGCCEIVK